MTGATHHMKGKGGEAAPSARAVRKNGLFRCEGPSCNGRFVSYLNGGCNMHPFRDNWNKEYNSESRASGTIVQKPEKKHSNTAKTAKSMWNTANPNHARANPKKAKKAKAKA